jgi:DNA-binding NarL/FixJ family response regulator
MVTNRAKTKSENQPSKRASATFHEWEQRVDHALRNLGDRSVLNRSPLARLAYIEKLASEQYNGHLLPRGLALHDILLACVEKISTELGNEPGLARACSYLDLLTKGLSCQQISRQLGLSREHVSRVYRRKAIELVTEEFLFTIRNEE